jgi:hypothetical protein
MLRSCARPDCGVSAEATLSYDYAAGTVWVEALAAERNPMAHDLCDRHADRLVVPRGWTLEDRRPGRAAGKALAS